MGDAEHAAGVVVGRTADVVTLAPTLGDFAARVDWIALDKARAFARTVGLGIVGFSDFRLGPSTNIVLYVQH